MVAAAARGVVRYRPKRHTAAYIGLIPAAVIVVAAYIGTMLWTIEISFTDSKLLPVNKFIGFAQYERLFSDGRWNTSLANMAILGCLFVSGALVIGLLLAIGIDQRIRAESTFRTIFLYPQAMSFIVTGLVWQWILNPTLGVEKVVQDLGWTTFEFDWIVDRDMAIYVVVLAALWQSSGLVMAILLAGLRGVDPEIWRASRIDGIPTWRVYLHVVVPMLRPMVVTAVVLLAIAAVKSYDLVVALTNGGPGRATEVPAKYVMNYLFDRQNIGLAAAASTFMLITVLAVLAPWVYAEHIRPAQKARRAA